MARAGLWRHSTLERCRKCGKVSRLLSGGVQVRSRDGHAGLAGLVSCGSVWVCPVCNAKVMQRRALEVGAVIARAHAEGLVVAEFTFTLRHTRGDRLRPLWDAVGDCWGAVTHGRQWTAEGRQIGRVGFLRAVEVTYGSNGFHPHVHAALIAERLDEESLRAVQSAMFGRWVRKAVALGLDAPRAVAQEAHLLSDGAAGDLGRYLTEANSYAGVTVDVAQRVGMELTQTQSKRARSGHGTSPVWELLDGANNGTVSELRLWREWEAASHGRRQISYSRGLRERFGLVTDLTDEEIAGEELGTEEDAGLFITSPGWARMVANPDWIPDALAVQERAGWQVLSAWLSERAVEHVRL